MLCTKNQVLVPLACTAPLCLAFDRGDFRLSTHELLCNITVYADHCCGKQDSFVAQGQRAK